MLHPALHPALSPTGGSGVVSLRGLPMGTVLWGRCSTCTGWTPEELAAAPPPVLEWLDEYGYRCVDGSLLLPCNGAHLLNHSCEANALDHGMGVGIAVRDIAAGEEITCDYRTFQYDLPWSFRCRCGNSSCVGLVASAPTLSAQTVAGWLERLIPARAAAALVAQELPLVPGAVTDPIRERV